MSRPDVKPNRTRSSSNRGPAGRGPGFRSRSRSLGTAFRGFDTTVASVAGRISRRRFVQGAAGLGLATGLGVGGFTAWLSTPAQAMGTCAGGACGPSPLCSDCFGFDTAGCGANSKCHGVNRQYNQFYCGNANCWVESWPCNCYEGGTWSCCDCCSDCGSGTLCSSCTGTLYACICRHLNAYPC